MAQRLWRCFWLMVLLGHVLLALAWWWLSPGGFGPTHPRFWSNRVVPPVVLGLSIAALVALRQDRMATLRRLLPLWPAAWAAGAVMFRIAFPIAMAWIWMIPMALAATMGFAAVRPWRAPGGRHRVGVFLSAIGAGVAGAAGVGTMLPPASATHPRNDPLAPAKSLSRTSDRVPPGVVRFGSDVIVQTGNGLLMARVAPLTIAIQPFLTFLSRSSVGCPVLLVLRLGT